MRVRGTGENDLRGVGEFADRWSDCVGCRRSTVDRLDRERGRFGMKPITQDKFEIPKDRLDVDPQRTGNCFQAALASIFELTLDEVPHFMALPHSVDWFEALQKWLLPRGLCAIYVDARNPDGVDLMAQYAGYYLSDGKSPRGSSHTVVSYQGNLAHDPHPSGEGLAEETERLFFVALDVSKIGRLT